MDYWSRVLACRGDRDSRVRSYRVQWIHDSHVTFYIMLSIAAGLTVSAAIIMICGLIVPPAVIIVKDFWIKVD